MRKPSCPALTLLALALPACVSAQGIKGKGGEDEPRPIRFTRQPTLAPDGAHLAFSYLGDIWTASATGGEATRLTIHEAHDYAPAWSPDGKWMAFSSKRSGNYDVWIMPVRGGRAKQLTMHSADDTVTGWTPDGKNVIFTAARETTRYASVYTVNIETGATHLIAKDDAALGNAAATPDGKSIVCTRGGQWSRKGYRGSGNSNLMLYSAAGGGVGQWLTHEKDVNQRWSLFAPDGKSFLFVSDRDGVANLWRRGIAADSKATQITHFKEGNLFFPTMAKNDSRIVFEHDFRLWSLDKIGGQPRELEIFAPSDDRTNPVRHETLTRGAQEIALSPDGKSLAFVVHGEVYVQPMGAGGAARSGAGAAAADPAAGGGEQAPDEPQPRAATESRRLTETPQREENVVWSPDGKKIAFTSDRDGNNNIYVMTVRTKQTTQLTKAPGDEHGPVFSPDGKSIAFLRGYNGSELCVVPAEGGAERVLAHDPDIRQVAWSPDSQWIAYGRIKAHSGGEMADIFVVGAASGKPINMTRYPMLNSNPVWSADGKKLFFRSNRSKNENLWSVTLLAEPAPTTAAEEGDAAETDTKTPDAKSAAKNIAPVKIDFDDIHKRARQLTRVESDVRSFALSPDGKTLVFAMSQLGRSDLWRMDATGGQPTRLTQSGETGEDITFTPDGQRVVYITGGAIHTVPISAPAPAVAAVTFTAKMDIDTHAELTEMFDEAWRKMRDAYYDDKLHGSDWNRVREAYRPVVDDITYKEDFYALFGLVLGELNSSHVGITGVPDREGPVTPSLGITLDDTYTGPGVKVATVVPKGPADRSRSRLKPGEILLKVDGETVATTEQFYSLLADKAAKRAALTVSTAPTEAGTRTVRITPIAAAAYKKLDYDRWVSEREKTTDQLSNNRLGYLHMNAMNDTTLEEFKRLVYGDMQSKDGLVIDVRFNGGGSTADEILEILQTKIFGYRTIRADTERTTSPLLAWNKPCIVLINELSFSNAEVFPWGFKELHLGKVVGVPTNGGVIGTGATTLIDGTTLRIPGVGAFTLTGIDEEHNGCPPDLYVENTPEDIARNHDRQLETAVQELLRQTKH